MVHALTAAAAIGALILPHNGSQALSSANFVTARNTNGARCRHCTPLPALLHRRRHSCLLRAVAENSITSADTFEFEEEKRAVGADEATDFSSPPPDAPSTLTVVAGPGARITSVSSGVVVDEQDIWGSSFVDGSPLDKVKEETATVDFFPFPENDFHEDNIADFPGILTEIKNENDTCEDTSRNNDNGSGETETSSEVEEDESSGNEGESGDDPSSTIRSTMANSALLHRAGIAGNAAKRSSRSNGRSSRARTHVNKSGRRGSTGVGAMGKVLGTVRTAAAAAAAQKKLSENNGNAETNKPGDENNSLKAHMSLSNLKSKLESTVSDMMKAQDAAIQQQSVGVSTFAGQTSTSSSPPPGTASMGLLGEVVQDELPAIPPLPGSFLAYADDHLLSNKPRVAVRSSVPHSLDDAHIANLRLSVFSRFDAEQQQLFRSRSVEVLNTRRRRGAVVLVAEVPKEEVKGIGDQQTFPNDMQTRIANGYKYGDYDGGSIAVAEEEPPASPTLTVTSVRGAKVTSASPGITINCSSPAETSSASIIGSIECSHQEFHGTMLGASRPKGSLLYVTEVAVRTDARRCGAGAMLMKGVDEVAALRNVETIYLHVDVLNRAACAMYEKCGYHYLDKREPLYAQFTASLNLHDGAMHGRKHYLLCKDRNGAETTWL